MFKPTYRKSVEQIDAAPIILKVCTIRPHYDLTNILSSKLDRTSMLIADG